MNKMSTKTPVGIDVLDNVVPNHQEIVRFLQSTGDWQSSTVNNQNGVIQSGEAIRTSETLFLPMLSWNNNPIIHDMNRAVWSALDTYAFKYNFLFSLIEEVSVQKYQIGDFYEKHIDSGPSTPRICSAVLYLNDVVKGGETYFTHFDFGVRPVAGRLAVFPSNYVYEHEALPPKSGQKIAAAYWAR